MTEKEYLGYLVGKIMWIQSDLQESSVKYSYLEALKCEIKERINELDAKQVLQTH